AYRQQRDYLKKRSLRRTLRSCKAIPSISIACFTYESARSRRCSAASLRLMASRFRAFMTHSESATIEDSSRALLFRGLHGHLKKIRSSWEFYRGAPEVVTVVRTSGDSPLRGPSISFREEDLIPSRLISLLTNRMSPTMKTDHANDVSSYDDFEMHGLLHVLLAVSALLMRRPEGGRQRVDHRPAKSSRALLGGRTLNPTSEKKGVIETTAPDGEQDWGNQPLRALEKATEVSDPFRPHTKELQNVRRHPVCAEKKLVRDLPDMVAEQPTLAMSRAYRQQRDYLKKRSLRRTLRSCKAIPSISIACFTYESARSRRCSAASLRLMASRFRAFMTHSESATIEDSSRGNL
ncbi:hypothetical protein OSTOST_07403, partial [Ostertagia ostertagi]